MVLKALSNNIVLLVPCHSSSSLLTAFLNGNIFALNRIAEIV